MSSIPLPALSIRPVESPLDQLGQAMQLKNMMQANQINQVKLSEAQQQQKDQQATTAAMNQWDPTDPDSLPKLILKNGGSANAAMTITQTIQKSRADKLALDERAFALQKQKNDKNLGALRTADDVSDDELPGHLISTGQQLIQDGSLDPQHGQMVQGLAQLALTDPKSARQHLSLLEKSLMGEEEQFKQAKEERETKAKELDARYKIVDGTLVDLSGPNGPAPAMGQNIAPSEWKTLVDNTVPPSQNPGLNMRTQAQVQFYVTKGNFGAAQKAITEASQQMGGLEKQRVSEQAENARQALNRQAQFANTQQSAGLKQLEGMYADPQRGYTQFLAQANATKDAASRATTGDQLAASLTPMMTALGITSYADIHRVNTTEINQAGPTAAGALRKVNAILDKVGKGTVPPEYAKEVQGLMDNLIDAKHQALVQSSQMIVRNNGLDPNKTFVLDRAGNVDTLSNVAGKSPQRGGTSGGTAPEGTIIQVGNGRQIKRNGKWEPL